MLLITSTYSHSKSASAPAHVTVEFRGYTNQSASRWTVFRISNSGPAAVECDLGQFEWADLPLSKGAPGAVVMGCSALLKAGESREMNWISPTRGGAFRFCLPVRRAQTLRERWHLLAYYRLSRLIPKPQDDRPRWIVASSWTTKLADPEDGPSPAAQSLPTAAEATEEPVPLGPAG